MWSGKKAQSAVEVSVLIFLIAIAMVGYVILLPAGERAALLGESNTTTTTTTTGTSILSESPGAVGPSKSTVQTRTLSPIRLYSTTNAVSKPLAASLTISRNLLQNNYKAITFNIDNPSDLQDLKLVFLASSHKGNLNIDLNGNTVFQGEVTSDKLPIVLPTDSLKAEGNVITLSTSLNWNLFSPNYYLLQDIQLLQGYTVADTSATRTFTVDDASQISSATLTYYITCNSDEKGVLTISMNDQEAFADRVFCQYLDQRELNLDVASLKDSNNLKFEITKGDYNIEEAMITLKTKQKDYPKFTFDISSNDFKAIQAGTKDLYLQMTFSPDSGEKRAAVLIQGNSFNFDTEADTYERKISSYIDDGANTITLEPSTSFIIDNLKVYVK